MCAFQGESPQATPDPDASAITVSSLAECLLDQEARARLLTVPSVLESGGDVLILMGLWGQHFIIGREHSNLSPFPNLHVLLVLL